MYFFLQVWEVEKELIGKLLRCRHSSVAKVDLRLHLKQRFNHMYL